MNDALRTDIHIAAGRHLSVLAHTHRIHALPIVRFRIVGNHHTIRDHYSRGEFMAGEQTQRMTAIHHKRLLVGHLAQVFHHEPILCPVLEDGSVATVDNQLMGMLGHTRIQVVLNHQHDGCRLTTPVWIVVDGTCIHVVAGTIAVHIDAAIAFQLFSKLRKELCMQVFGEIAQSVAQSQPFLLRG